MNRQRSLLEAILHRQDGKIHQTSGSAASNPCGHGTFHQDGSKVNAWLAWLGTREQRHYPVESSQMCATGLPSPREWGLTGSQARTCTPWEDILGYYIFCSIMFSCYLS